MEERRRLSFWFFEVQTEHLQAIIGTPWEVPVPKNVIFICLNDAKWNFKSY